ncbi:ZIP family metal transporter [Candidatus Falkowbacteria bacterium]|uniref:Zinc transporter n=1 Tax=Candidatus Buchananbacteria bacterium CG10_big_fil_rev_8_21_14_0_10_33_19 TaxID=1974525 RepID=A0A2H0W4J7_9BACT|nr:ZIP family metal transporter [Candidatus Falkowbacteria bacterium]PIS06207.1 MAG: zinc transporter [Candidatus Buchananbacteria bacterium CG10_big_fil_rev_8_21_14_0_10_33_19]
MSLFLWIIAGTIGVSLLSLAGALVLVFNDKLLSKIVLWLVAFSAGSLIGGAFLHMIPESFEVLDSSALVFMWVIVGFSIFFALELFVHWHHCHHVECEHKEYVKPTAYLILVADALHNFIDGLAIAGAFIVDIRVGIVTTLIVATHEIPQELGDFGVLINSGWKKGRALLFNLASGLTAVLGGLLVYFIAQDFNVDFLLPLAAGGFIYVASSDLIPEVKHHDKISTNLIHFTAFILGIVLVMVVGLFE